jgi:hypothetical protein
MIDFKPSIGVNRQDTTELWPADQQREGFTASSEWSFGELSLMHGRLSLGIFTI